MSRDDFTEIVEEEKWDEEPELLESRKRAIEEWE
jgi:hypothetical protein